MLPPNPFAFQFHAVSQRLEVNRIISFQVIFTNVDPLQSTPATVPPYIV